MINNRYFFYYNIISLILISFIAIQANLNYEQQIIENLSTYISMSDQVKNDLYKISELNKLQQKNDDSRSDENYLFNYCPILKQTIPYISFCDLPTPITKASNLAQILKIKDLYIKRDDLTGKKMSDGSRLFGGNKPRKLEFLLADALKYGARSVITFGCSGSNHATATAVYCKELGLKSILMLKPQVNSQIVRRNLLLDLDTGAEIIYSPTNSLRNCATISTFFMQKQQSGIFPYVIPTGASCSLGALGFVNAAFELKEQIKAGIMPEPTRIYVALGSAGTMVGLLLGSKLAGIKTKIIGVTIEPEERPQGFLDKLNRLFTQTYNLLKQADASIPDIQLNSEDFEIIYDFCGLDYALFTPEGISAIDLLKTTESIKLDGVYTGKAFACLLNDIKKHDLGDEIILFWNTFSSDKFEEKLSKADYHKLPDYLHFYFENEVQELDR